MHIHSDIDSNFNERFENQFITIFVQTNTRVSVGLDFLFNFSFLEIAEIKINLNLQSIY